MTTDPTQIIDPTINQEPWVSYSDEEKLIYQYMKKASRLRSTATVSTLIIFGSLWIIGTFFNFVQAIFWFIFGPVGLAIQVIIGILYLVIFVILFGIYMIIYANVIEPGNGINTIPHNNEFIKKENEFVKSDKIRTNLINYFNNKMKFN